MKPLSLALIRGRYVQDGGAEQFVTRALSAIDSRNVKVTLIARKWPKVDEYEVIICNPFYFGRLWRDHSFARGVCHLLDKKNFDLVQSHERISCCDIYRAGDGVHREWLKQRARKLGLFGKLGMALNPYHYYVKNAEKALFLSHRLRAVICNSHMVKDEIRDYFGIAEEKLHVIYSGVDMNDFHPELKKHREIIRSQYNIPENATLYLFVGSGFERKGVAMLLNAMAELPQNTYLLVVGRDKKLERYLSLCNTLRLSERVSFVGSQPDVKPFYGAADVLVLPTLYDPFPNVALEAMACGLPVVTSTKSGASELIKQGENGFTCDALDSKELVDSMKRLTSKQMQSDLGVAARRTVEPLSLDRMRQELLKIYQHLM